MLLNLLSFGLMVAATLIYGSSLGWRRVLAFWAAFIVVTVVVGGVFHAFGLALLSRLGIAIAMLVKGRMGGSSSFS
jgi:hypothetical protein